MSSPDVVVLDPFEDPRLRELVDLAGAQALYVTEWDFDLPHRVPVLTTVPVPSGVASRAVGLEYGKAPSENALGEVWPARSLALPHQEEDLLSWLAGASRPRGLVIQVSRSRGGLGATTFAATLARELAKRPLCVALVDSEATPRLSTLLGLSDGATWEDLSHPSGPFLPRPLAERLPVWHRVKVLTAHGGSGATHDTQERAIEALAHSHDVVIVDRGRDWIPHLRMDIYVPVMAAAPEDCHSVNARISAVVSEETKPSTPRIVPVVRRIGSLTVAEVAGEMGTPCVELGTERQIKAASLHGAQPGDRKRGAVASAARLAADLCEASP